MFSSGLGVLIVESLMGTPVWNRWQLLQVEPIAESVGRLADHPRRRKRIIRLRQVAPPISGVLPILQRLLQRQSTLNNPSFPTFDLSR